MGKIVKSVAIAAAFGALSVVTGGLAAGAALSSISASSILTGAAISGGLALVSSALAPKMKSIGVKVQGQDVTIRSASAPRNPVLERTRVGTLIAFHTTTGADNRYFHLMLVIAPHQIDAIEQIQFGDTLLALDANGFDFDNFNGKLRVRQHLGGASQPADSAAVAEIPEWTSAHRGRGAAYLYMRLEFDPQTFPRGFEDVRVVVRGHNGIFDPRTGLSGYTDNLALLSHWHLTDSEFGFGARSEEVDTASVVASANICDEPIDLAGGGAERRYRGGGMIDAAAPLGVNRDRLLDSMAGRMIYQGGVHVLQAGAYRAPVFDISEADIIGPIRQQPKPSVGSLVNSVSGLYAAEAHNWAATDFVPVTSAVFKAEDGGVDYPASVDLAFTPSEAAAQRLAKLYLFRQRAQRAIETTLSLRAFQIGAGDTVRLTLPRYGWADKEFEVEEWGLTSIGGGSPEEPDYIGCRVRLRETSLASYDWTSADETVRDAAAETTLGSPFDIGPPSNVLLSGRAMIATDGATLSELVINWDAGLGAIDRYEVEWREAAELFWDRRATVGADQTVLSVNVAAGRVYTARVRAVSRLGATSAWAYTVGGLDASADAIPPGEPTLLTAAGGLKAIRLNWINAADADLDLTQVWRARADDPAQAIQIAAVRGDAHVDSGLPDGADYFYWVRAVDRSGNLSAFNAASGTGARTDEGAGIAPEALAAAGVRAPELVSSLPTTGNYAGRLVFLTRTDGPFAAGLLYEWDETAGGWFDKTAGGDTATLDGTQLVANSIVAGAIAAGVIEAANLRVDQAVITNEAQIAAATVGTAQIQDLSVGTIKVADGSISTAIGVYTAGPIWPYRRLWETIQSAAINSGGLPVSVIASAQISLPVAGIDNILFVEMRILRNGSQIYGPVEVGRSGIYNGYSGIAAPSFRDSPGGGAATYTVQIRNAGSPARPIASARSITLLTLKK